MRHILNSVIKFSWFVISNILFPTLIFAVFIILENSLLIQTNSITLNFNFINYKGNQLAVNINTSFCNNITALLVVCVDIFACLKIAAKFISKKICFSYIRNDDKLLCNEINAYNLGLSTGVSYLRI